MMTLVVLLGNAHTEETGFKKLVSCNLKQKNSVYVHFFHIFEVKVLVSCKFKFTLHKTNCLKPVH